VTVNKERLSRLADFVEENVEPARFNMNVWYSVEEGCGMAACLGGWATHVPEFRVAGFRLRPYDGSPSYEKPDGGVVYGFGACQAFFELDGQTTMGLFSPSSYEPGVSLATVVKRVRDLVAA
jgi:hypothetical protein